MSTKGLTQKHRPSTYFDGPPIAHCPTYSALVEDAIIGSQNLLRAIQRAGVRP